MKIETKEIYKCEHCRKLYQVKKACEKHEAGCKKRPDYLRPCHSCKVLAKRDEVVYYDTWSGEGERTVSVLFCGKRDCFIHPPSVASKGIAFDMGYKLNVEMPKQCEFYEKNGSRLLPTS